MQETCRDWKNAEVRLVEKLAWGSLLLGGLLASLDWKRILAKGVHQGANAHIPDYLLTEEFKVMSMVAFFTAVATFLVMLLLVWLAERRRINWVRWLLAALFVLGGPSVFANLKRSMSARLKSGLGHEQ
jgi:hypothetical protein